MSGMPPPPPPSDSIILCIILYETSAWFRADDSASARSVVIGLGERKTATYGFCIIRSAKHNVKCGRRRWKGTRTGEHVDIVSDRLNPFKPNLKTHRDHHSA